MMQRQTFFLRLHCPLKIYRFVAWHTCLIEFYSVSQVYVKWPLETQTHGRHKFNPAWRNPSGGAPFFCARNAKFGDDALREPNFCTFWGQLIKGRSANSQALITSNISTVSTSAPASGTPPNLSPFAPLLKFLPVVHLLASPLPIAQMHSTIL